MTASTFVASLLALLLIATPVPDSTSNVPDDGMWTFDNLPFKLLKEKYGFEPTKEWLDHLRLSSVRVSTGGSGSFVSPNGLIMTNHHVALELVSKLSTTATDFVKAGFLARKNEDELKCPEAEIRHLVAMKDVTAEVEAAAKDARTPAESAMAVAKATKSIEAAESEKSGLTVDVVTLYGGGQYVAYAYKIWSDIRLVFAPEMRAAFYGGDDDNFVFPRFCLDCAFLRAYEDGKPADTSAYHLKWSKAGAADNELVFVSGHPGDTGRLLPYSRIKYERDVYQPVLIDFLKGQERSLVAVSARSEEDRLRVLGDLFGVRNSLKAYEGQEAGLLDPAIMAKKEAEEARFRKAIAGDSEALAAFAAIDDVVAKRSAAFPLLMILRFDPTLSSVARAMKRLADEAVKLGDSDEAERVSKVEALFEKAAALPELQAGEIAENLGSVLSLARKHLGRDHAVVKTVFGAQEPEVALGALLKSTHLLTPGDRKAWLAELAAGKTAPDALLDFVAEGSKARAEASGRYQQADAEEQRALTVLAKARFRAFGKDAYPDATFTLRLSYGTVRGYEQGTTKVPYKTTFYGLFGRNAEMDDQVPFDLPERWKAAQPKLDLATPYNFVSTCDIIGGNSGSPVVNKNGEVVGLIFDGNIQSLPGRYLFDERQNRAVSVHSVGITHALDRVFDAKELLAELGR